MKRFFFLIGYWIVHLTGILPLKLKTQKKKKRNAVVSGGSRTPWAPWTSSNWRSILIGLFNILVISYNTIPSFLRSTNEVERFGWNLETLRKLGTGMIAAIKAIVTVSAILVATIRRREIEGLLNDVCSSYSTVLGSSDLPDVWKFAHLVVYVVLTFVVNTTLAILLRGFATPDFIWKFFWQLFNIFTLLYLEVIFGVIFIYLQAASLLFALCHISMLFTLGHSEERNCQRLLIFAIACIWCSVRISVICHDAEIVIKEARVTMNCIASIDASEIDGDSKLEILTSTLIYVIIVVQYLSP